MDLLNDVIGPIARAQAASYRAAMAEGERRGEMKAAKQLGELVKRAADDEAHRLRERHDLLRRWVAHYEDLRDNTDGRLPDADAGCIECTHGTVPNSKNTGPCVYHATKALLAKAGG